MPRREWERCPRCGYTLPLHPFVFPTGETVRMCESCCTNLYKKFHKARKAPPAINDSSEPTKRQKRINIGKPTIRRLFEAQDGRCVFCPADLEQFHVDHIIPIARGGSNDERNLQLLCPKCNLSKSAKDPAAYMMEMGIVSKQDIFILSGRRR